MRHRKKNTKLGTDSNHRKALLRNLLRSLFEHGQIVTTTAKAKEVKRQADKLIFKAQDNSLKTRRLLHKYFGKRDVVNTLVERIAPAFKQKTTGFTKLEFDAVRRGDNTQLMKLSLEQLPEKLGDLKDRYIHASYFFAQESATYLRSAKVIISRAGAHQSFELMLLCKKAILIPIPWVSHNEQMLNAQLVAKNTGSLILEEPDLSPDTLLQE